MPERSLLLSNLNRLVGLVPSMTGQQCASLVHLMAKPILGRLEEEGPTLQPADILNSLYGLGKFNVSGDGARCMGILAASARRHIWNYSIDDCAQMVASLARARVQNPGFITRVVDRVCTDSVRNASFESVVNLMTGLARCGVISSKKKDIWRTLADEISERLTSGDMTVHRIPDILNALTAYSYPNVNNSHDGLFGAASTRLREGRLLTAAEVSKYLKACARVQFRDPETLKFCGNSLRASDSFSSLPKEDLLAIFTSLDKLGADMPELTTELSSRGVSLTSTPKPVTWFRARSSSSLKRKHS